MADPAFLFRHVRRRQLTTGMGARLSGSSRLRQPWQTTLAGVLVY